MWQYDKTRFMYLDYTLTDGYVLYYYDITSLTKSSTACVITRSDNIVGTIDDSTN